MWRALKSGLFATSFRALTAFSLVPTAHRVSAITLTAPPPPSEQSVAGTEANHFEESQTGERVSPPEERVDSLWWESR